ncbi:hypothetical protein JWG39_10950 [Desulforhopalus vacuolatus]|uniref:hypothetical protein n=1 Tax=Desulforhopalus vacuolatus TaxID=40414 RepID=UPI0019622A89|nr:hypothetical protein [Desulforhopalus vacuolatus]MBM9520328.1 hypothetical protein [Desulforhopalus vacuolatus]
MAAIAYYIARFMRGSLKLSLPRTVFNPGDTIAGSFHLHTKKVIEGNNLIVRLVGTQHTKTYEDGESETHSREIYRDEVFLEEAKVYAAGSTAQYDFEISTPNVQSPEFLNSTAGQFLTAAVGLLSNKSTHLKWEIEARLDAKGVDLAATKSISINTRQLV